MNRLELRGSKLLEFAWTVFAEALKMLWEFIKKCIFTFQSNNLENSEYSVQSSLSLKNHGLVIR